MKYQLPKTEKILKELGLFVDIDIIDDIYPKTIKINKTNNILYILLLPKELQNLEFYFGNRTSEDLLLALDDFLYKRIKNKTKGQRNPFFYFERNVKLKESMQDFIQILESSIKKDDMYCILPYTVDYKTELFKFFSYEDDK